MNRSILILMLVIGSLITALSQQPTAERAEVMVLGVYHMSNPGHDIYNMKADNVLAPKRQAEIAQLIEVLKKFHPTKIAIEAEVGSQRIEKEYSDYLAGKYTLTSNETNQIGYRLAKELGHHEIYPVDIEGDFPWQRLANYAKANGISAKLDSISAGWGKMVQEQSDILQSKTILETLEYMNSDARAARDMGLYFATVPFGDPYDDAGPDLLAAWYQRNIRIYNNIVKLIESPNERILVIYGAGHLGWLRQNIADDASVQLRKLDDFVK